MKSIFEMNKRGDFTGGLYFIVMIAAFAFFLLVVGYISTNISSELKDKFNSSSDEVNQAFDATINTANNTLSAVWFVMFGGLLLGLLISAWYMRFEIVFVPVFLILLVVTIIVGVAMSNAYEQFYTVSEFGTIATTQVSINFVMSNLPYVAFIIGIIAIIITFVRPKGGGSPMM